MTNTNNHVNKIEQAASLLANLNGSVAKLSTQSVSLRAQLSDLQNQLVQITKGIVEIELSLKATAKDLAWQDAWSATQAPARLTPNPQNSSVTSPSLVGSFLTKPIVVSTAPQKATSESYLPDFVKTPSTPANLTDRARLLLSQGHTYQTVVEKLVADNPHMKADNVRRAVGHARSKVVR